MSPFQLRFGGDIKKVLPNAGRHLTAVDPSAHLVRKMGRVFHSEWATERGVYPPHLFRCEQHGVHHRGWWYAEPVPGNLPEDLASLATAYPATLRSENLPAMWRRRCVRTWAWLRHNRRLTDAQVKNVDDSFDALLPVLAPTFLILDGVRFVVSHTLKRMRSKENSPDC